MQRVTPIEQVLHDLTALDGQLVALAGLLFITPEGSFLCAPQLDPSGNYLGITLDVDALEDRCFPVVPAYIGAPWYYRDPATVRGRVVVTPETKLTKISEIVIHRDGQDHLVPLS